MKNKSLAIIIIQSILIIGLLWLIIYLSKDKIFKDNSIDDDIEYLSSQSIENGIISMSDSLIKNSGITIQPISKSKKQPLYSSYGYVINLKDLINFKTKFSNLNFKFNQLNKQIEEEIKHFKKLKTLNEDNKNIADSVIHSKEIDINKLQNNLKILKNNKRNLLNIVEHEWGDVFKKLLVNPKKSPLKNIFNSDARLLKITITDDQIKKSIPLELKVFSLNQPDIKFTANFISEAPIGNLNIQGKSYYYLALNSNLMIDSKVNSFAKLTEENATEKFFMPGSAIIWNNGQAWVYKKIRGNKFLRQAIFNMKEVKDGWIVEFKNKPPESIVTNGAQLLLSEEYKHLIKNENED